jgi:hypothetical protein
MKKTGFFLGFIAVFLTVNMLAFGQVNPWIQKITGAISIDKSGVSSPNVPASLQEGIFLKGVARFVYDTATDGGSTGAHALGVYLPARAVITQSYYKIITQFTDSGSGTVALSCEDANNILTAGDITGISANTITTGASTGSAASMVRAIGARCEITATVATATQDAGKLIGWVEYVIEN